MTKPAWAAPMSCASTTAGRPTPSTATARRKLFATDGICTHGNTHLADGLVKGGIIECPKHNGRYNLADGSPARAPVCRGLCTYPIESATAGCFSTSSAPAARGPHAEDVAACASSAIAAWRRSSRSWFSSRSSRPSGSTSRPAIICNSTFPAYDAIRFRDFDIPEPYAAVWETQHVFDLVARNPEAGRRNNYSLASNPQTERILRFNVRIATPPPGQDCPPGVGSAYMFSLKPGDTVTAIGPFGDFHIKPTQKEMVYIGGGSGMAPLRAHLSHLFETEKTARRVSFWYGARSRQEIFYQDYFEELACASRISLPPGTLLAAAGGQLDRPRGFIHEVVLRAISEASTQTPQPWSITCAARP